MRRINPSNETRFASILFMINPAVSEATFHAVRHSLRHLSRIFMDEEVIRQEDKYLERGYYCTIGNAAVLESTRAFFGRKGTAKEKLYFTFTFTVQPTLL